MRVDSSNNIPYTCRTNVKNTADNSAQTAQNPKGDVVVRLELSHAAPPVKEQSPLKKSVAAEETPWLEKEWKRLKEWARNAAEKTKELWKKVTEKAVEMIAKLGNLWQQEERPAENGVPQVTWQENFRRRVKIVFDAVKGFLSGHLPMGHGNFSEAKKEEKEEEFAGKEDSGEKKKEPETSVFDVRG